MVLPAYNAERTLEATVRELPEIVDDRILVDDHSSDAGTRDALAEIARDYRVGLHNLAKPSGNIGELKGHLCSVASGQILLELDHDDVLTPDALAWTAEAFRRHPECGVAYTNWQPDSGSPTRRPCSSSGSARSRLLRCEKMLRASG